MSAASVIHKTYAKHYDKTILDSLIRHMGTSTAIAMLKYCDGRRGKFYNEVKNHYDWGKEDKKQLIINASDLSTQVMNIKNSDPNAAKFAADVTKYAESNRKSFEELCRDVNKNGVEKTISADEVYSFVESYRFLNAYYLGEINGLPQKDIILRHFRRSQQSGLMDQLLAQPVLQCIPGPARRLYTLMAMLTDAIKRGAGEAVAERLRTEGQAANTKYITYHNTLH